MLSGCVQAPKRAPNQPPAAGANSSTNSGNTNNSGTSNQSIDQDNSDITTVIAPYSIIEDLNGYESNEDILYTLFGWADKLDYSQLEKVEIKEDDYKETRYMDKDKTTKIGWSVKESYNSSEFTYHFPGDKEKEIQIRREDVNGDNNIVEIHTQDLTQNSSTKINMFLPTDGVLRGVSYLSQSKDYLYDGLYFERFQGSKRITIYEMSNVMEYYSYGDNVLLQEEYYSYSNNDVSSTKKTYNSNNGNLKSEYSEYNGMLNGLFSEYFEDGTIFKSSEWIAGKLDGQKTQYYASGKVQLKTMYAKGLKHGKETQYWDNNTHQIMETAEYDQHVITGIHESYTGDGTLKFRIMRDYGKVIWQEQGNTRTYYNSDGTVNRREPMN